MNVLQLEGKIERFREILSCLKQVLPPQSWMTGEERYWKQSEYNFAQKRIAARQLELEEMLVQLAEMKQYEGEVLSYSANILAIAC